MNREFTLPSFTRRDPRFSVHHLHCAPIQSHRAGNTALETSMPKLGTPPTEITGRDDGCGELSQAIKEGESVLVLGGGKMCSLAAQVVGSNGQAIGIRRDSDSGGLSEYENVEFRKGSFHDFALDLDAFDEYLKANPIRSANDWIRAEAFADELRRESPLVEDESIDVVIADAALESVNETNRERLFSEVFRVLRIGGRAVIHAITSDEPITEDFAQSQKLEAKGVCGSIVETELLAAFEAAGFHGLQILGRQKEPLAAVEGIEFRTMTVAAHKGESGECLDGHHAVVYRGPWKAVLDDDGQTLHRGERMAVCARSFERFTQQPYADELIAIEPQIPVPEEARQPMDCRSEKTRDPRVSKGRAAREDESHKHSHPPGGSCC
jgi:arsenite methyltransferase